MPSQGLSFDYTSSAWSLEGVYTFDDSNALVYFRGITFSNDVMKDDGFIKVDGTNVTNFEKLPLR
jgi:hypothetical protein